MEGGHDAWHRTGFDLLTLAERLRLRSRRRGEHRRMRRRRRTRARCENRAGIDDPADDCDRHPAPGDDHNDDEGCATCAEASSETQAVREGSGEAGTRQARTQARRRTPA
jgi:hypothetical protein